MGEREEEQGTEEGNQGPWTGTSGRGRRKGNTGRGIGAGEGEHGKSTEKGNHGQLTGEGEQGTTGRGESFATGAENLLGRFKTNY